jgi:hypothetical protein
MLKNIKNILLLLLTAFQLKAYNYEPNSHFLSITWYEYTHSILEKGQEESYSEEVIESYFEDAEKYLNSEFKKYLDEISEPTTKLIDLWDQQIRTILREKDPLMDWFIELW